MSEIGSVRDVFNGDEVRDVLRETFYAPREAETPRVRTPRGRRRKTTKRAKAAHYDVICISLYNEDLRALDEKVDQLKAAGHRKMSRSALIRYALDTCDLEALPKSY